MKSNKYTNPGGGFSKGNPGRPKGTPTKTSKASVEQILQALEERGGLEYMKTLDAKVFASLIARVIPRDVNITGQVTFEHRLAELERTQAKLEGRQTELAKLPPPD